MGKIITIANQKGGIGKTTTATAIAAELQRRGSKVLLIDTDPQCSASDTYRAEIDGVATMYDILCENEPVREAVQHTEVGSIIPCDPLLSEADKKLTGLGDEKLLKKAVAGISQDYDYIVVDTPPGAGIMLYNALAAADYLIIPITADRYGLQGLSQLKETIEKIKEHSNQTLIIAGMLLIKHNERTNLSKTLSETLPDIAKAMETVVFKTFIRDSISTKEAQTNRTSLLIHAPGSTTAQDYSALLDELQQEGVI